MSSVIAYATLPVIGAACTECVLPPHEPADSLAEEESRGRRGCVHTYPQTRDVDAFGHHADGHQPFGGARGKRRNALKCAGVVRGDHSCSDPQLPSQQLAKRRACSWSLHRIDLGRAMGLARTRD